jgi:electron transfer flavoprotein alpha subunit
MNLPKVNTDLCIGCGICIDICPMNAISLVDGKAFIDPDQCGNCRVCKSECPMHAIN